MSTFWRVVWIVARERTSAIEARSRELINTTFFFAAVVRHRVLCLRSSEREETAETW
jgi:putative SOS response-associated peptidase YedK